MNINILNATEDQKTAIAHLSMLRQMATGDAKRKPKDAEERFAIICHFILTGECKFAEDDEELKQALEQLKLFKPLAAAA